jgi:diketogulonate reductase-like aldo/keto reductase
VINRRKFIANTAALTAASVLPSRSFAEETIRTRPIPASGEELPVIGMGAPRPFIELPPEGEDVPRAIIHELMSHGGTVIDTPAFNRGTDPILGPLLTKMGIEDDLFLIGKVTTSGRLAGKDHLEWTQRLLSKRPIDAMLVHNMRDLQNNWPLLQEWKEQGRVRYIGVSRTRTTDFTSLEKFLEAEKPDFLMTGYSITQQGPADRVLPLCREIGTAVVGAEPFKARNDGAYFDIVSGKVLPDWAAEFDCESWAQFSLKWILGDPAMTCIVTETSKAKHARDNMRAGLGRLPDPDMRKRMSEYFLSL